MARNGMAMLGCVWLVGVRQGKARSEKQSRRGKAGLAQAGQVPVRQGRVGVDLTNSQYDIIKMWRKAMAWMCGVRLGSVRSGVVRTGKLRCC